MTPSQDAFQKISLTFISVFFCCAVFANTGVHGFFIKKGTQVTEVDQFFIGLSKPTAQGVLYVKGKTVFHAGTFTSSKVVYISNFKELAKNQKVVPSFREEKHLSKVRNTTIKTGIPFSRLPFRGAYLLFYYQYCMLPYGQAQADKNAPSFLSISIYIKNSTGNSFFSGRFKRQLKYANTIKINRLHFLGSFYCRPPPVA